MYRITLDIGKSTGYECSVEPNNTALAAGKVGLYIGNNAGMNAPMALRALQRCAGELEAALRQRKVTALYKVAYTFASDSTAEAAASGVGTETTVTAIVSVANIEPTGRSLLISAALAQCLEVARELMNVGYITGVKP